MGFLILFLVEGEFFYLSVFLEERGAESVYILYNASCGLLSLTHSQNVPNIYPLGA